MKSFDPIVPVWLWWVLLAVYGAACGWAGWAMGLRHERDRKLIVANLTRGLTRLWGSSA